MAGPGDGMNVITALLAFVVTMIVLSTIVAAAVQIVHRLRRLRSRHLKLFIQTYFDQVILPHFGPALAARPAAQPTKSAPPVSRSWIEIAFDAALAINAKIATKMPKIAGWPMALASVFVVFAMAWVLSIFAPALSVIVVAATVAYGAGVRARRDETAPATDDASKLREKFVQDMTVIIGQQPGRSETAENLSPVEFAARLGRTEIGRAIAEKSSENLETLVVDLIRRFDSLGAGATASFAELSRRWSVRVAFLIAVVANVDAVTLLQRYVDNPALSDRVAALGPAAAEGFQKMQDSLRQEMQAAQQRADANPSDETAQREIDGLKQLIANHRAEFQRQIASLADAGVPIGWTFYPFCLDGNVGDLRCKKTFATFDTRKFATCQDAPFSAPFCLAEAVIHATYNWVATRWNANAGDLLGWLVGVAIAGALIGLGGPFWFDVYQQLSVVVQFLRGVGLGRKPVSDVEEASAEKPKPDTAHAPPSAVEAFRNALAAQQILASTPSRPRVLLDPDGRPAR